MKKDKKKRVYLDFEDYWKNGKHGWSSASIQYAREIWDDLEPTIKANRSAIDEQMVDLFNKRLEWDVKFNRYFLNYLKEFNLEEVAGVKFFRWMLEQSKKEKK